MEKQNYDAGLPVTNAPFNLCVRHGDLIFISGLPPFDQEFSRAVREAREQGRPIPPFPNPPFAEQVRLVMDNMKKLVEAVGSNMDCLLKVIVRRAIVSRFPFSIFYLIEPRRVVVLRVLHTARDPKLWPRPKRKAP